MKLFCASIIVPIKNALFVITWVLSDDKGEVEQYIYSALGHDAEHV